MSDEAETEFPVLVVVRHEKGVLSWQLPMLVQVKLVFYHLDCKFHLI